MKRGYVRVWRKIIENPISNRPSYIALWLWLLLTANHKQKKIMWNGEILIVNEGQLLTGRKELSQKTGIPETTIEDILKILERQHQIRQQKTTKFRIITILNWSKYQNSDITSDNKPTTSRQQADTNNNDNNYKNNKKELPIGNVIQKGSEYVPDHNPPKKRKTILTEKQKTAVKRMLSLSYFHKKGIENGFEYLLEEDDQANRKFIGLSRAFEKRYPDRWKEVIDWWFSGDNAWCDYHPSNFFTINTYMKFDNKKIIRQDSWDNEKIKSKKIGWN